MIAEIIIILFKYLFSKLKVGRLSFALKKKLFISFFFFFYLLLLPSCCPIALNPIFYLGIRIMYLDVTLCKSK